MQADSKDLWSKHANLFASALLNAEKSAPDFLTSINGINDERRYAVYKNNVTVSLIRALESNFPAIVRLIGEEYFAALARLFVEHHPPKTRILSQYGATFPEFLNTFEPLADYPYLGDVAQLEQNWREAFHEADAVPIAMEVLAKVPPEQIAALTFKVHPATRILQSNYAAGSIFSTNRSNIEAAPFDPATSEFILITRPHFECFLRILSPAQGIFVAGLINGKTLASALERVPPTDDGFDLAGNISGILEAGAFCDFGVSDK
jgi:hypothetical protein